MESNNTTIWLIIRRMRIPFLVIIITFSISILGLTLIPGVDDNGHPYKMTFFDAFYFVSYMASTIGFGEAPYTFSKKIAQLTILSQSTHITFAIILIDSLTNIYLYR